MEEIKLTIPEIGEVSALPLQDLPVELIMGWMTAEDAMKPIITWKLFTMAVGSEVSEKLTGLTYREAAEVLTQWQTQSVAMEPGKGEELDFWRLLE